jgi:hypothetical protein
LFRDKRERVKGRYREGKGENNPDRDRQARKDTETTGTTEVGDTREQKMERELVRRRGWTWGEAVAERGQSARRKKDEARIMMTTTWPKAIYRTHLSLLLVTLHSILRELAERFLEGVVVEAGLAVVRLVFLAVDAVVLLVEKGVSIEWRERKEGDDAP